MSISFCVGVWWLWGRGEGQRSGGGGSGVKDCQPKIRNIDPRFRLEMGVWFCSFFWVWGGAGGPGGMTTACPRTYCFVGWTAGWLGHWAVAQLAQVGQVAQVVQDFMIERLPRSPRRVYYSKMREIAAAILGPPPGDDASLLAILPPPPPPKSADQN